MNTSSSGRSTAHGPNVFLAIPCFNVASTIQNFFDKLSDHVVDRVTTIIAIDNSSTDATLAILQKIQGSSTKIGQKLIVIANSQNYGYGGSQKILYRFCLDHQADYLMVLHGDDQGFGDKVAQSFLDVLGRDEAVDLILASRFLPGADISWYSRARTIGNLFFNQVTWLLTGLRMSDAGTAILCVRVSVLRDIPFESLTNSFQFHPELNIFFYGNPRLRLAEVPLDWKDSEAGSSVRVIRYGLQLLWILGRYRLRRSIFRQPPEAWFWTPESNLNPVFQVLASVK